MVSLARNGFAGKIETQKTDKGDGQDVVVLLNLLNDIFMNKVF